MIDFEKMTIPQLIQMIRINPGSSDRLGYELKIFLDSHPELKIQIPFHDLSFLYNGISKFSKKENESSEPCVPKDGDGHLISMEEIREVGDYSKDEDGDELASWYADLWSQYASDGLFPTEEEIQQAHEDLEGGTHGVSYDYDDNTWYTFPIQDDGSVVRYSKFRYLKKGQKPRDGELGTQYVRRDGDKGWKVEVSGESRKNQWKVKKHEPTSKPSKEEISDVLSKTELSDDEKKISKLSLGQFKRHNEEKTLERLKALHKEISDVYHDENTPHESREGYARKIKSLEHMMEAYREKETPQKLFSVVKKNGGLNTKALMKDYNLSEDFIQSGLMGLLRREGGVGLDDMAKSLYSQGHVSSDSGDALLELLKQKAVGRLSDLRKEIEDDEKQYYMERENAIKSGLIKEVEAIESGSGWEEEGSGDAFEGNRELGDSEIDFNPSEFETKQDEGSKREKLKDKRKEKQKEKPKESRLEMVKRLEEEAKINAAKRGDSKFLVSEDPDDDKEEIKDTKEPHESSKHAKPEMKFDDPKVQEEYRKIRATKKSS